MEGGQKYQVPLDSGLDVKSSDQLVPVGSPLFQHNRQRFQGSMLPASLRYEHNGWACGWDVYEFEVGVTSVGTEPDGYTVIRARFNDNPAYIFQVRSGTTVYVQIWHNAADTDLTGGLDIAHETPSSIVKVTGESNGNRIEITIDMLSGEIGYDDELWHIAESDYFEATASSGVTTLNVTDLSSQVMFNAAVMEAGDVEYNGESIAWYCSCADGRHVWKDTAGGAWTVECETESGEAKGVTVNGDSAAVSSLGGGALSIAYNTEYSGNAVVSVSGEKSYMQIYDLGVKQQSAYVSSSGASAIDKWSVYSSGSLYLYPSSSGYPVFYIKGSVPYWVGLRAGISRSVSRNEIISEQVNFVGEDGEESDTSSANSGVYIALGYYFSSSLLSLYDESSDVGSVKQFWIGSSECLSEYASVTEDGDSGGDSGSISASLTYCVCVLNRIAVDDDSFDDISESPFELGSGSECSVEENAPWFDGGSYMSMSGATSSFGAGFYAPVKEAVDGDGNGTGKYTIDIDGVSLPESYYYSADDVIGEDAIDSASGLNFNGYARVESPLAYYDQSVTLADWRASRCTVSSTSGREVGLNSVAIECRLAGSEYSPSGRDVWSWGYAGFIRPYYRTTSSSSDTRTFSNIGDAIEDDKSVDSLYISFHSGPLMGLGVKLESYSASIAVVSNQAISVYDLFTSEERGDISGWSESSLNWQSGWESRSGAGIIWCSEGTFGIVKGDKYTGVNNSTYWSYSEMYSRFGGLNGQLDRLFAAIKEKYLSQYPESSYNWSSDSIKLQCYKRSSSHLTWNGTKYVYYFKYFTVTLDSVGCDYSLLYGSSTISSFSESGEHDITSGLSSYLGIAPRYACIKSTGTDENSVLASESSMLYLSVCYDGLFQSALTLGDTDNHFITDSNISGIISVSASSALPSASGFYVDRAVSSDSGSLFGVEELALSAHLSSFSSSSFTCYMFMRPASDSTDVYMFSATDSSSGTCYIPGNIYYGSASSITNGYNLTGDIVSSVYGASSLIFSVIGSVAPFYAGSSTSVSWDAESGAHEFYSSALQDAVKALAVGDLSIGTIGHEGNGRASFTGDIELALDDTRFYARLEFTQSGGSVSVGGGLVLADGADERQVSSVAASFGGYGFTFELAEVKWGDSARTLALGVSVPLSYAFFASLPYQYNYKSLSYDNGKYHVDGNDGLDAVPVGSLAVGYDSTKQTYAFMADDGYSYTYNASTKEIAYGAESYDTRNVGDARTAEIDALEALELSFILQGAWKISKGSLKGFDGSGITFEYDGQEYSFDFSALMSDDAKNRLAFICTDTTDDSAVPQSVTIAVQDTEGEYQFLRQAWNTLTEVENYWWIDENTILELNKSSLTVKRKVSSLDSYDIDTDVDIDDWGGDAWTDACSFDRGDYLDNTVVRHGVTCAYGGEEPRFWTVKLASALSMQITFYKLERVSDYNYSLDNSGKVTVTVPVNVVGIGSALNASELSLNTYSQLSAETIVYEAKYSGTVVDGHILFGIHLDNNFNQWALDIFGGGLELVVQGYGFVGLNGCLTGGEIPAGYFNAAKGFDGTVMPLDTIEQDDVEYVDSMSDFLALDANGTVVGDESQQWYISKSLSGIVSHLTWNGSSWDAVTLPITNTYAACYGSPSYGKRLISDFGFWGQSLSSLISDDGFSNAVSTLTDLLATKVYGFSPKVTTAMYLQQTMGQYAYVHYNSASPGKRKDLSREDDSENIFGDYGVNGVSYTAMGSARQKKEEPVDAVSPEDSDDFSFNLHGIRQSVSVEKPWSGSYGVMMVIMSSLSAITSTLSGVLDTVKVNASEGKVNIGMKGSEMSQIFLQNMSNLATTDISVIGVLPTLQSAVGSACTLDMFYSTSEGQKVCAGPGWVQHNMVAQCVAQSVTSCQWEMQQIGMLWILDGLSSIVSKLAYELARIAWELICEEASATKEGSTMMTNYGWMIAVALVATGGIAYAICATYKTCAEITDALVKSICGGSAKVEVQNASSKHTYDVEGKHKYGEKNETFMWPCFGVNSQNTYTDETVEAKLTEHNWGLHVPLYSGQSFMGGASKTLGTMSLEGALGSERQDDDVISSFEGDVLYQIANCKGKSSARTLPSDMAVVTGVDSFLPPVPFRNGNIGVSQPVFPTSCFQDYIIDKDWELSRTAGSGWTTWISCKDTKLIDGDASNIVVSEDFCGVAAPYVAIEVKRGCEQKYIRPWAITPNTLALNNTGYNCCYDRKAYHAFDGYGYRIVKWCGAAGMNKQGRVFQYSFIANDRLKRSNKMPLNEFLGNFKGDPVIALRTTGDDEVYNHVTYVGEDARGFEVGVAGEDKDSRRYALPVFSELVSTLPAVVKTVSSSNLSVIDGITSLTTDNRDLQSAYKAPVSVDFAIGKSKYRFTEEYISQLDVDPLRGVTTVKDLVPTLGLTYLGSTPYEAYLYSQATRQYYTYSGESRLEAVDTLERFRDVLFGRYDFVNQEVALPCVATFARLDKHVLDDEDERDNTIVPRLKGGTFVGEIAPPLETIYNMRSGFKTVSLPSGLCYQGPNRCIINRFVYSGYMKEQIKENYGKWKRVPRERYNPFRSYGAEYERVDESVDSTLVGWTHNPFLLVTAPLGVNSETDCMFEWEITFAWPVEMDDLYNSGQYAVVNIMGECFAPGGKAIPGRPVHVFLYRDLFTRTGNYGYYSFRYQSRCGAGNRERLHVWSDQYIAVSGLQVDVKPVTEKRTEILTQAADVQYMEEA